VAESASAVGQNPTVEAAPVRNATSAPGVFAHAAPTPERTAAEVSAWRLAQAATSIALTAALVWALAVWLKVRDHLPLSPAQRFGGWVLLVGGVLVFAGRSVVQILRWSATRGGGDARD
jgi:hypothetical protein